MTFKKIITSLYMALTVIAITSCDRSPEWIIEEGKNLNGQATVKVHNNIVGSARNNIFVDNVNVTGSTGVVFYNTALGSSSFPNTVLGFAVNAGNRSVTIRDTSTTTTQVPLTFTGNFEAGKNYTIFTYDSINAPKYKLVETPLVIPAEDTISRIRFANMVRSAFAVPNVDVYSVKKGTNIFTNVPVGGITDYINVTGRLTDTLYVRATGTTTNLTLTNTNNLFTITPTYKRSYTIIFRGVYTNTTTANLGRELRTFTDY